MSKRDSNGRFVKGISGNPNGRPKKKREERYYEITVNTCTFTDWERIVNKAIEQAADGDVAARKWLSDYLVGSPLQRLEHSGPGGTGLVVQFISNVGNDNV